MLIPLHDDNPTTVTPVVTWTLMAGCVVLWLATLDEHARLALTLGFGYIPARSFHDVTMPMGLATPAWPVTLLSYQFLHGGLLHLAGNMLYLWIFANNIEEAMGRARFLAFYLLTGALAALAHALTDTASTTPLVGASGAISGVLGAYLLLHPHARVLCVFSFFVFLSIRIPAYVVIGVWFGWQLLMLVAGGEGNVAWMAHIGGLVAGLVLTRPFLLRTAVPRPAPAARGAHAIEPAAGGGFRVAGRWFPRLDEAETYRRALDERQPVQVHRRRPAGEEEPITHYPDGTYGYRDRRFTSLEAAARALLEDRGR